MDSLNARIAKWNSRFPFDLLWRRKYNVSFGSKQHLSMNQIDIIFDIIEPFYLGLNNKSSYGKSSGQNFNFSDGGDDSELDSMFDNLDLSKFDDP